MLEEKEDNLQEAEGNLDPQSTENIADHTEESSKEIADTDTIEQTAEEHKDAVKEVHENVAEDAEDESVTESHEIPELDYHSMTMDALVTELNNLITNEKVQAIKNHVEGIKNEFRLKYNEVLEQKKEEFIAEGGNAIDFRYSLPIRNKFNDVYAVYKKKRSEYYKSLEQSLKENLSNRLALIEELKGLLNVEENINSTYKHFKKIQESWRNAGSIPKIQYNNVWRTYHHHVERFYDFLHLNRDLRDLDFKHNLEEKQKIVARAEELVQDNDVMRAFRELQTLHKFWKEEIGPVAKEHREEIWNKFSAATKAIHDKRQEYFKDIDKVYEQNLVKKQEIIAKIKNITGQNITSHNQWQNKIREVEALREDFFKAGKVPIKVNEETWAAFKGTVRDFNSQKNAFYKSIKKEQQDNLAKKLKLIELAESLKDSEDWNETTPIMKKVQADWKKIGHVPKKVSDKVWKQFKNACNHYFDKLHAERNAANKEEMEAFEKKSNYLKALASYELSGDTKQDVATIKEKISEWKTIGRVPFNKKNIEGKFYKIIDALFKKLDIDKQESELIKYSNKLENLDERSINSERIFIRRKIDDISSEMRQLQNNLQFFSSASSDNPMVQKVHQDIEKHKKALATWKAKLNQLRSL